MIDDNLKEVFTDKEINEMDKKHIEKEIKQDFKLFLNVFRLICYGLLLFFSVIVITTIIRGLTYGFT